MKSKANVLLIASFLLLFTFLLYSENIDQKIEISENAKQESSPWWSSNIVNLIGIFVAVCLLLFQLWLQHKSSMKLQVEDYRNKYRLEIYNEISEVISPTTIHRKIKH